MTLSRRFIFIFMAICSLTLISTLQAEGKKGLKAMVELSPAGSFEVTSKKFKGDAIAKVEGGLMLKKMTVPLDSLKSGLDLRDEHLHKRLKHDPMIEEAKGSGGTGKAMLSLGGVKKEVAFSYRQPDAKNVIVNFTIKLSDYSITDINYMGVGVKDDVKIEATLPVR